MKLFNFLSPLFIIASLLTPAGIARAAEQPSDSTESTLDEVNITKTSRISVGAGVLSSAEVSTNQYNSSRKSSTSFQFGYEHYLSGQVGLEGQIMYRSRNVKYEYERGDLSLEYSFLSLPIALKGYVGSWKDNSFFVKGGLMPSYNTSRTLTWTDKTNPRYNLTSSGKDEIEGKNLELAMILGAGKSFQVDEYITLTPEIGWIRGLTDITTNKSKIYESSYAFYLNVSF